MSSLDESGGTMESARRTLLLLRVVNGRRGRWFSLSEVAHATGLPNGTLHRYLNLFVEEGILERSASLKYAVAGSVPPVQAENKQQGE